MMEIHHNMQWNGSSRTNQKKPWIRIFSLTAWCCSHSVFKLHHPLVHISIRLKIRVNEKRVNNQTGSPDRSILSTHGCKFTSEVCIDLQVAGNQVKERRGGREEEKRKKRREKKRKKRKNREEKKRKKEEKEKKRKEKKRKEKKRKEKKRKEDSQKSEKHLKCPQNPTKYLNEYQVTQRLYLHRAVEYKPRTKSKLNSKDPIQGYH